MNRNDQQFAAQRIRARYLEKQTTELDTLRALDTRVRRPAAVFAYIFGSISAVIMGAGMSLVMTDIGATVGIADPLIPGIVIGIVGMILALINYPIYKGILGSRKRKYGAGILALSEKIMKE
jgi:hypothetical protein